jgi:hypothetical protein
LLRPIIAWSEPFPFYRREKPFSQNPRKAQKVMHEILSFLRNLRTKEAHGKGGGGGPRDKFLRQAAVLRPKDSELQLCWLHFPSARDMKAGTIWRLLRKALPAGSERS